ncbi:MAG: MBL fold metallo-hydrolase [Candidatus Lokiarchaeota archaeon]|nr:MBL fold metallo-hydrolase [Candidatus Lokiarchaeota archaeon]
MYFKKIDSEGLSHFSYILGSLNDAVVIDPKRDIQEYLDICIKQGFSIKYIFETHRNEDYIIGSREFSRLLPNAEIFRGNDLPYEYGTTLRDGQRFTFGDCKIKAIHTPGHTLGHYSYVVYGENMEDQPQFVFTGDALFAGDTGRTDFYGEQRKSEISGLLYDSIHQKILPLGDEVILCPAHGSGSVCGSKIEERFPTTIGIEKKLNSQLKMSRNDFVKNKVEELHTFPPYFKKMEEFNLGKAPYLYERNFPKPLNPKEVQQWIDKSAQIVDTRNPSDYGGAHIKGSICIWLEGLPSFSGWMLNYEDPIILILEKNEDVTKATNYLSRIGFDNIVGFLNGGLLKWCVAALPIEHTELITVHELKTLIETGSEIMVLDVRSQEEWNEGHLSPAFNIYAGQVPVNLEKIPKDTSIVVHCSVGLRATVAASALENKGYKKIKIVLGSYNAWENAGYPIKFE